MEKRHALYPPEALWPLNTFGVIKISKMSSYYLDSVQINLNRAYFYYHNISKEKFIKIIIALK